jgi:hypothetical protein
MARASRRPLRRQDHRHCLWVDRFNDRVRCRGHQVRAGDGLRLGATIAFEFGPESAECEQGAIIIEREPDDDFLFGSPEFSSGAYSAKLLAGTRQDYGWPLPPADP